MRWGSYVMTVEPEPCFQGHKQLTDPLGRHSCAVCQRVRQARAQTSVEDFQVGVHPLVAAVTVTEASALELVLREAVEVSSCHVVAFQRNNAGGGTSSRVSEDPRKVLAPGPLKYPPVKHQRATVFTFEVQELGQPAVCPTGSSPA